MFAQDELFTKTRASSDVSKSAVTVQEPFCMKSRSRCWRKDWKGLPESQAEGWGREGRAGAVLGACGAHAVPPRPCGGCVFITVLAASKTNIRNGTQSVGFLDLVITCSVIALGIVHIFQVSFCPKSRSFLLKPFLTHHAFSERLMIKYIMQSFSGRSKT